MWNAGESWTTWAALLAVIVFAVQHWHFRDVPPAPGCCVQCRRALPESRIAHGARRCDACEAADWPGALSHS